MIFKVGKYYKHIGTGELLHIVGEVTTTMYGNCLVGEVTNNYDLIPVGKTKDYTMNFVEISKNEWDNYWEVQRMSNDTKACWKDRSPFTDEDKTKKLC